MKFTECVALLEGLKSWRRIRKIYDLVQENKITFDVFQKILLHFWWIE